MVLWMQYSGYSKKFRHEVVNAVLKAYDEIHRKAECGERPVYQPFDWNRDERDKAKRNKAGSWYLKGGYESVSQFVPSTPDSILQEMNQSEQSYSIKSIINSLAELASFCSISVLVSNSP